MGDSFAEGSEYKDKSLQWVYVEINLQCTVPSVGHHLIKRVPQVSANSSVVERTFEFKHNLPDRERFYACYRRFVRSEYTPSEHLAQSGGKLQ